MAQRLNINTATAAELGALSCGLIGPVRAANIMAYREANALFQRVNLLMAVPDIGPTTYECVRELVTVGKYHMHALWLSLGFVLGLFLSTQRELPASSVALFLAGTGRGDHALTRRPVRGG